MCYPLEHLLYFTRYWDTDHAVRMHDVVGELCDRGPLCFVFLHGFDNSKGSSNRLIREYIPDPGILIEYNTCMLKSKPIIKVRANAFMKRKGKNLRRHLFSLTSLPAATLFRMMVLGFVIQNVEGILKWTQSDKIQ